MSLTVIPPWKNPVTAVIAALAERAAIGRPPTHRVPLDIGRVEFDAEAGSLGQGVLAPAIRDDMSVRCQKNGSRSSSKHSTKV